MGLLFFFLRPLVKLRNANQAVVLLLQLVDVVFFVELYGSVVFEPGQFLLRLQMLSCIVQAVVGLVNGYKFQRSEKLFFRKVVLVRFSF